MGSAEVAAPWAGDPSPPDPPRDLPQRHQLHQALADRVFDLDARMFVVRVRGQLRYEAFGGAALSLSDLWELTY
jgi:hypothetical protein